MTDFLTPPIPATPTKPKSLVVFWLTSITMILGSSFLILVAAGVVLGISGVSIVENPEMYWVAAVPAFVMVGVILLIAARMGRLRSILFERERVRGLLPLLLSLGIIPFMVYNVVSTDWQSLPIDGLVFAVALAGLQAGISEEVVYRGIGVHVLRRRLSEIWVAITTAAMFGIIHVLNVLFGAELGVSLYQASYAFLFGLAFYALRRVTGSIFLGILLHALNNTFSQLSGLSSRFDVAVLSDSLLWGGLVLGAIAAFIVARTPHDHADVLLQKPLG